MVYRPTFRKQLDGSACQGTNCGCASSAMASQRAREGSDPATKYAWPPTSKAVRAHIQAMFDTGCRASLFSQNERVCAALYKVDLQPRYNIPYATFRGMILAGRGAVAAIQYSVISPTRFDACPGFGGGHSVYVNERREDGSYLVFDPLADGRRSGIPNGPKWWPGSLLRDAMYAYPGTNKGCVHASFTRDTE